MIFYLILFSLANDEHCTNYIDISDVYKTYLYDVKLSYSTNYSNKINLSYYEYQHGRQSYDILNFPVIIQVFAIYRYCSDWVPIYTKNVTSANDCPEIKIKSDHISEYCYNGVSIRIYNNIEFEYNITIMDSNNNTIEIKKYWDFLNNYYFKQYVSPFSLDIYLKSPYFDGLEYLETIKVNEDWMEKEYNISHIPTHLLPEQVNYMKDLPYFYEIGYRFSNDTNGPIIKADEGYFQNRDPFEVTIYLLSGISCSYPDGLEILKIHSEKNTTALRITYDHIPDECKIEKWPDDSPNYQPPKKTDSNARYSFIYEGECDKFDNLLEKCRNDVTSYTLCPFINNAVEAKCADYDTISKLDINIDKLFIVLFEKLLYHIEFSDLKHQTIIHIKGTDARNIEDYFQNPNTPTNYENHRISDLEGDFRDKISYLTLENVHFSSDKGNPLKVNTIYMKNSEINYGGFAPDNLILDNSTSYPISGHTLNQFSIVMRNTTDRVQYRVDYKSDRANFCYKDVYNESYECIDGFYEYYKTQTFGIIGVSHYFDLHVDSSITKFHPLNISLFSIDDELTYYENPSLLDDKPKYYVNLTTSGDWSNIIRSQNVYFTAYHDLIELDTHLDSKVNLTQTTIPIYQNVTWAPYIFQPFDYNTKSLISYIVITDESDIYSCERSLNQILYCRWKDCSLQNGIPDFVDYIVYGQCTTKDTINDYLGSIPEVTDKLIIENYVDNAYIDFNKLNHQVVVQLTSFKNTFNSYSQKRPSYENAGSLIWKTVLFDGDIKEKVSYLTISNSYFAIKNAPLNIHTLKLQFCDFDIGELSESINTHDLIADFTTHVNIFGRTNYFNVEQYGLVVPYDESDEENELKYRIEFSSDKWSLFTKNKEDYNYEPINENYGYIPYNYADSICLFIVTHEIDFYITDSSVNNLKNINITVLTDEIIIPENAFYLPENDRKYKVNFTTNGYWDSSKNVDITFTSFNDLVQLNTSSENLNITHNEIFNFTTHPLILPTMSQAPYPSNTPKMTAIPTKTPVPEYIGTLFEENQGKITNTEEFNKKLNQSFEKLGNNGDGNCIIEVNANSFPFDRELQPNQFIKPMPNSQIDYKNGNLNMYFPDEGKVTIKLNNNDDKNINLSLNGHGEINLEGNQEEISITQNSNINGTLTVNVPDKVTKVTLDSVDLSNEGSIDCNKPLSINNVNVNPQASISLKSLNITNTLSISQTGKITFDDVDVKGSKIVYNLLNYNELESVLYGNFGEPPDNIEIHSNDKEQPQSGFYLIEGYFDNDNRCDQWKNIINFDDFHLSTYCQYDYSSKSLEASKKKLFVDFRTSEPTKPESKGNGLPTGAIIGIVFGVIAAVAIVVVVVIIIIRKKKNNQRSASTNEGNEEKPDEV